MAKHNHAYLAVDFEQKRCWRFRPTQAWLCKNPCDCSASIGFILGEHMTHAQLSAFIKQGNGWEVSFLLQYETPKAW